MATPEDDVRGLLCTDPDYIYCPRFDYSLAKLMERYPDGAPDRLIAQVLLITEEEVEASYQTVVMKLRKTLGVKRENG